MCSSIECIVLNLGLTTSEVQENNPHAKRCRGAEKVKYCSGNWIYDLHLGCEVQQGEDIDSVLCQMRRCTASHCSHWNSIFTNSALDTNMWHREICSADDQNSIQINISGSCLTSDSCISFTTAIEQYHVKIARASSTVKREVERKESISIHRRWYLCPLLIDSSNIINSIW
ncbi:hypothetical protein BD769DRAFT_1417166 [Suillus cothurnatus]|nr:hypothetical protein BD769DRAFT_1417120 [Suillus cothurnatus]KAG2145682.1 hypothetical protein BD769DRAFT_1417166 [Suillus cothurnatus]